MTREELARWFRRFRYDPEFRSASGAKTVPIMLLCDFVGVPRQNLYQLLEGKVRLSANYERRLTAGVEAVQQGLRWKRLRQRWVMVDEDRWTALPRHDAPRRIEGQKNRDLT
jgi:hypothetical protein